MNEKANGNGWLRPWRIIGVIGGAVLTIAAVVTTVVALFNFVFLQAEKRITSPIVGRFSATDSSIADVKAEVRVTKKQIALLARAMKENNPDRLDMLIERVQELSK